MAVISVSRHSIMDRKIVLSTWNNQRLESHDEDGLHWSKLIQPQLSPLIQRKGQLGYKGSGEPTDADSRRDVRGVLEPCKRKLISRRESVFGILHAKGQTEAYSQSSYQSRCCDYNPAIEYWKCTADHLDLEQEGRFDADK